MVDQEFEEGLRSVAAPIHDENGSVIAAVNVSAHADPGVLRDDPSRAAPAAAGRREADRGGHPGRPEPVTDGRRAQLSLRAGAVTTRAGAAGTTQPPQG